MRAIICSRRAYRQLRSGCTRRAKSVPKILSLGESTPTSADRPFRIKYLEAIYNYVNKIRWRPALERGEQILDWYRAQTAEEGSKT